jgi:hypothetical protein
MFITGGVNEKQHPAAGAEPPTRPARTSYLPPRAPTPACGTWLHCSILFSSRSSSGIVRPHRPRAVESVGNQLSMRWVGLPRCVRTATGRGTKLIQGSFFSSSFDSYKFRLDRRFCWEPAVTLRVRYSSSSCASLSRRWHGVSLPTKLLNHQVTSKYCNISRVRSRTKSVQARNQIRARSVACMRPFWLSFSFLHIIPYYIYIYIYIYIYTCSVRFHSDQVGEYRSSRTWLHCTPAGRSLGHVAHRRFHRYQPVNTRGTKYKDRWSRRTIFMHDPLFFFLSLSRLDHPRMPPALN